MSIYPVPISEWFVEGEAFGPHVETLKDLLPYLYCEKCNGPVPWEKGYIMHSAAHGGPSDAWCCLECLLGK